MERGLYIAASGMIAEQIRQDQISNDLAKIEVVKRGRLLARLLLEQLDVAA